MRPRVAYTAPSDTDTSTFRVIESADVLLNDKSDILLPGFFEGPEKLLEVIFDGHEEYYRRNADGRSGLRCVPREEWSAMLVDVGCEIVSTITSPGVDAFLLRYAAARTATHTHC